MTASTFLAMSGTTEVLALVVTFVVHVAGAACLVWALLDDRGWGALRGWWSDDGTQPPEPRAPDPRPSGPGLPLPLPDAAPSAVRLREPVRIGDGAPRPQRRPAHVPEPGRPERV